MNIQQRNNVQVAGSGATTLVFAHGFGCDQNMWRLLVPAFAARFRIVAFDLVGNGGSDLSAYDRDKYATLHGHADDVVEILDAYAAGPVVFVGHSVGAMIGALADLKAPGRIRAHVMIGPSPSFIDDGDYIGGFSRADIDSLLETLEGNYLGWSSSMAPAIMGAPDQPELAADLTNSFCRTDPDIAAHFARVTFLADHREDIARLQTPVLVLQCSDDLLAPMAVGAYLKATLPHATLRIVDNIGHCPHLSEPGVCAAAMNDFLAALPASP